MVDRRLGEGLSGGGAFLDVIDVYRKEYGGPAARGTRSCVGAGVPCRSPTASFVSGRRAFGVRQRSTLLKESSRASKPPTAGTIHLSAGKAVPAGPTRQWCVVFQDPRCSCPWADGFLENVNADPCGVLRLPRQGPVRSAPPRMLIALVGPGRLSEGQVSDRACPAALQQRVRHRPEGLIHDPGGLLPDGRAVRPPLDALTRETHEFSSCRRSGIAKIARTVFFITPQHPWKSVFLSDRVAGHVGATGADHQRIRHSVSAAAGRLRSRRKIRSSNDLVIRAIRGLLGAFRSMSDCRGAQETQAAFRTGRPPRTFPIPGLPAWRLAFLLWGRPLGRLV